MGNNIQMTLILLFLKNGKVFKIETPEVVEIDPSEVKSSLDELNALTEEELREVEDEGLIVPYTVDGDRLSIKFKEIEVEGYIMKDKLRLNIEVITVDWIKAEVKRRKVLENIDFNFVPSS